MTTQLSDPSASSVLIVPLGGVEEFGVNLTVYGHQERWIVVDCGAGFPDDTHPGIDLLLPNPAFLLENRAGIEALFITHAHEDHIGAVAHVWPKLGVPIYATPFACSALRHKFKDVQVDPGDMLREVRPGAHVQAGPFGVQYIAVAHSIPEACSLAIRTSAGLVLHTGDWKIDPDPVVGHLTDEAAFRALGEEGVLAILSDSTNAPVEGQSGSERSIEGNLVQLFTDLPQRAVVTCFSSNIARLHTIAKAAERSGRQAALVGRSLLRMAEMAAAHGYLDDVQPFLEASEIGYLPRNKQVIVCTGSQGEPRSALTRIAAGDHDDIELEEGDTVIYSSRTIPGNEKEISRVRKSLVAQGIQVMTDRDSSVHVSGHAYGGEITQLYQWTRPKVVIPVHGEADNLIANARLAEAAQVRRTVLPVNGSILRLSADGQVEEVGLADADVMVLDGSLIGPMDEGTLTARRNLAQNGFAAVSLAVDETFDLAADPHVSLRGVATQDEEERVAALVEEAIDREIGRWLKGLNGKQPRRDSLEDLVRVTTRRVVRREMGKRPMIDISLLEV